MSSKQGMPPSFEESVEGDGEQQTKHGRPVSDAPSGTDQETLLNYVRRKGVRALIYQNQATSESYTLVLANEKGTAPPSERIKQQLSDVWVQASAYEATVKHWQPSGLKHMQSTGVVDDALASQAKAIRDVCGRVIHGFDDCLDFENTTEDGVEKLKANGYSVHRDKHSRQNDRKAIFEFLQKTYGTEVTFAEGGTTNLDNSDYTEVATVVEGKGGTLQTGMTKVCESLLKSLLDNLNAEEGTESDTST